MSAFSASGTDRELLRRFVEDGGEGVFAELVRRHSGLVFSTALRRSGSRELAQEAAQNVFAALARKAARLEVAGSLAPWLHRAAVLETAALVRRESRYRHAMQRHQHEPITQPAGHDATTAWQHVRLLVDEALDSLAAPDRRVLLLRHVEGRTFPEMAALLGQSEAAVQRRSHRALQKLADRLRRRGVTVPALALGGALATGFAGEASAAAISAPALTAAALAQAQTTAAPGLVSMLSAWSASPAVLTAVFLLSAAAPVGWRFATHTRSTSGMALVPSESSAPPAIAAPAAAARPREIAAETRLDFLRQALSQLARTSPSEAPSRLGLQLRRHMLGLSADDLREIAGLLSTANRNHDETRAVIEAFSSRLAELEPEGALALLLYNPPVPPDEAFLGSIDAHAIVGTLARRDMAALLQVARLDADYMFSYCAAMALCDGRAVIELIQEAFANDPRSDQALISSFDSWIKRDASQAIRWLDENPDACPRILSGRGVSSVGAFLPAKEAVALAASVEDPLLRAAVITAVHVAHLSRNPEEFTRLTPFLRPEDEGIPLSVRDVVRAWRNKDAAGAAAWIESLPEGDLKAAAARSLAIPAPDAHLPQ